MDMIGVIGMAMMYTTAEEKFTEFLKNEVERLKNNPPTRDEAIQNLIKIGYFESDGKTVTDHYRIEG